MFLYNYDRCELGLVFSLMGLPTYVALALNFLTHQTRDGVLSLLTHTFWLNE